MSTENNQKQTDLNENLKQETPEVEVVTEEFVHENDLQEELEVLDAALKASEAKVQEQQDSVLRAKAEVENMRRRSAQEIDKARKFALDRVFGELLPVIDNLERAIDMADKENEELKAMTEGVELTLSSLMSAVNKSGLESLEPKVGDAFNPDFHQAMSIQENTEFKPNSIMAVMQKGYILNGRVIRPAMVMVTKAAAGNVNTAV